MIVTVKKLLIETSCDGLVEIETEPTDDEMRELGWVRADLNPEESAKFRETLAEPAKVIPELAAVIGKTVNGADVTMVPPLTAQQVLCESRERGAGCQLLKGHTGDHMYMMLDADPVQPVPLPCGCDTLDFHQMGCPKQKPAGKLPSDRIEELRDPWPGDRGLVKGIIMYLDERLGRS